MPNEKSVESVETTRATLKNKARKSGALAMAAITLGGLAAPTARAERAVGKAQASEIIKKQLRNPSELPGFRKHLGIETLNKIKNSTVEIGQRLRPDIAGGSAESSFAPSCTAVKVTIPGSSEPYIMTAAHCLASLTGSSTGVFRDSFKPTNKAENFTDTSLLQFAVLDPNETQLNVRTTQPAALIDQISISTDNKDVALLHPNATDKSSITSPLVRRFSEIPAIPLKIAEQTPMQGTPVALYGEPQASNFEAVSGTGTYLGRVYYEVQPNGASANASSDYREIDLVGINPSSVDTDNCNYGTSGSMALLQNGAMLGNLTMRTSNGYGSDKKIQLPDSIEFDKYWRPIWEQQLNVKLSGFSVICGYTVMDSSTPRTLLSGFNNPVNDKGGDPSGLKH